MHGSLPTKLRVLRAERGLTLRDAERLTGVDKDTLSKIERGRRDPQDITLAKIARGYDVPVEELLEEPVPLGEAPPSAEQPPLKGWQEERRHSETVLATELAYRTLDSWVKFIRPTIKDYEPIIRELPEEPSRKVVLETYMKLVPLGRKADSINEAFMESGVTQTSNELLAASKTGEGDPQDLAQKVREFHDLVDRLNSELMLPATQWLLVALDRLRDRPEPEQPEIEQQFREQLKGLEAQANLWAQKYGSAEAERQGGRVRNKYETA